MISQYLILKLAARLVEQFINDCDCETRNEIADAAAGLALMAGAAIKGATDSVDASSRLVHIAAEIMKMDDSTAEWKTKEAP